MKYVHRFTDRHGHIRYYFRRRGIRVPLPEPGSVQFDRAYAAALAAIGPPIPARSGRPASPKSKIALEMRRFKPAPLGGVYLLMQGTRVVYIGSSENMPARVVAHRHNGRQFDRAYYISVPLKTDRLELERFLISSIRPEQNGTGGERARQPTPNPEATRLLVS